MVLPKYYIVGERPVKMVKTEDNGLGVYAYDWETGDFVLDMKYLFRLLKASSHELEEVTEEKFNEEVEKKRLYLKKK